VIFVGAVSRVNLLVPNSFSQLSYQNYLGITSTSLPKSLLSKMEPEITNNDMMLDESNSMFFPSMSGSPARSSSTSSDRVAGGSLNNNVGSAYVYPLPISSSSSSSATSSDPTAGTYNIGYEIRDSRTRDSIGSFGSFSLGTFVPPRVENRM